MPGIDMETFNFTGSAESVLSYHQLEISISAPWQILSYYLAVWAWYAVYSTLQCLSAVRCGILHCFSSDRGILPEEAVFRAFNNSEHEHMMGMS